MQKKFYGWWITIFAFEIPPGGKSERLHHLYEDVVYVISGLGSFP